jgi:hypothetical protein
MKNKFKNNSGNSRLAPVRLAIGSLIAALAMLGLAFGQDISISASVDKNAITLGESIELTISLSGGMKSLPKPTLPDLSDFDVYSSGTSSNFSIGIGSFTNQSTYDYALAPRKAGAFTIQPITVVYQGKTYSTQPIQITVSAASQRQPAQPAPAPTQQQSKRAAAGEDFFIEQTVDNPRPFVGQQVIMTFSFYQSQNLYQQPSLQWPDYNGFWVEDLPPNRSYQTALNGHAYQVTEIKRALFPTVSGKLTINAATVTIPPEALGNFFDPFGMFGRRQRQATQEKVLRTDRIVMDVKPLPESGKPGGFTGAIGRYNLQVSFDKNDVEVDQPVSLKAILSGTGNIKKLPSIDIQKLDNFRLYDSGSNENISKGGYTVSGSKDYEWVLIPTAPGDYELPQVSFAYFDPIAQEYKTLSQRPGKVHVRPSTSASSNLPGAVAKNIIPAARTSLNYIVTDLKRRQPGRPIYDNDLVWILQLAPLGWLIYLTVRTNRKKRLQGDIAYARRKLASKAARQALKAAHEGMGDPKQFFGLLYGGVLGFISDKLNISAGGLTNAEVIDLLQNTGRCDSIIPDFSAFLNDCDAGRFSSIEPQPDQMKAIYDRAEYLLSTLDRSLK